MATNRKNDSGILIMLIAQGGPLDGMRWTVEQPLSIGRDPSCDVVIPDRQVSRRHARVQPTERGTVLEDLHSKNGTHHNGQRVMPGTKVRLRDGDVIQIALAQRFLVASTDATLPLGEMGPGAGAETSKALRLDPATHQVWIKDAEVFPPLSAAQFRLLLALYQREGEVVPREDLIRAVWGEDAVGISNQALDALVRRLRDRLAAADPYHAYVVTIRGHGLRLDNPPWP